MYLNTLCYKTTSPEKLAGTNDNVSNLFTLLAQGFAGAFANSPIGLEGQLSGLSESVYPPSGTAGLLDKDDDNSVPQLYLNILYFDKDMNFITGDYDRSTVASTSDFEQLELEVLVPMEGYMLIYVSNEEEQANIAYFDDINITHHHSPVIQENAYYPFGLQHASSYQRSYSLINRMNTFQDQEFDEETGWVQFKWRNHQPELGRFFNVDPLAEDYYYNSPYAFSENKVTAHIELEGLESYPINQSSNPLNYMAEGFRRMGDATLSLASATAEVFTNATKTLKEFAFGNTKISVKSSTKTSAQVKFDFSDLMNYSGNNSFTAPDNMIEFGVYTTQSITESVTKTTKVGNLPVNTTLSSTQNATDKSVTNTAEISVGVDNGNIQAKAFINVSSTNNSDGSTSNKVSMGAKTEVPVFKDKGSTITVGSQIKLEHEF